MVAIRCITLLAFFQRIPVDNRITIYLVQPLRDVESRFETRGSCLPLLLAERTMPLTGERVFSRLVQTPTRYLSSHVFIIIIRREHGHVALKGLEYYRASGF